MRVRVRVRVRVKVRAASCRASPSSSVTRASPAAKSPSISVACASCSSARLLLSSCAARRSAPSSCSSSTHRAQLVPERPLLALQWHSLTGTRQFLHVGLVLGLVGTMLPRSLVAEGARSGFVARGWRRLVASPRAGCGAM